MPELALFGTVLIGVALALGAWSGWESMRRGMSLIETDIREKLRRVRLSSANLHTYLICWAVMIVGLSGVVWIGLGPISAALASVLLVCLPWWLIRRFAERRREKIEEQLADAMVSMSSGIRSGLSLPQSLDLLARQCPRPISQEFQQMCGEYQMGKPLETVLREARDRLQSENFALFAAAVDASRESGGKLNETIERIAHSVRELQRLERKVRSETAQARQSAVYMSIAPVFILAMYYLLFDPENTAKLFTTFAGQMLLTLAAVLNLVAYWWARRILGTEI
jgi:tight adherence protein B